MKNNSIKMNSLQSLFWHYNIKGRCQSSS